MKYLYTIKEQNFIKDCVGVEKKEKILLKGTSLKKAIKEAGRIFRENKPEDFKVEDLMVAEKYDRKYDKLYQYVVLIEVDILDF